MSTKKSLPKGLSVIEHNGRLLAKLYDTLIVDFETVPQYGTSVLKLNNGGWATKHTKKCINLVLNKYGLYLVQEKFIWKLYQNGTLVGTFQDGTLKVGITSAA